MNKTLLLVDDEIPVIRSLTRLFRRSPYTVITANSGAEALAILEEQDVQVILSDFRMPGMTGGELLKAAVGKNPGIVGMLLSGHADLDLVIDSLNSGAVFKFMSKPWEGDEVLLAVEAAFERWSELQHSMKMARMSEASNEPYLEIDQNGAIFAINTAATKLLSRFDSIEAGKKIQAYFPDITDSQLKVLCGLEEVRLDILIGESRERFEIYSKHMEATRWLMCFRQISDNNEQENVSSAADQLALDRTQVLSTLQNWADDKSTCEDITVIYLDLVKFHVINDGLGYKLADQILEEVAKRVSMCLLPESCLGHMNADEFVVLFPFKLDEDECKTFITQVQGAFADSFHAGGRELRISFKAGVAWSDQGVSVDALLKHAHVAVANAKTAFSSDFITSYKPSMSENLNRVVELQSDLYQALEKNQLAVYYQPKISTTDYSICGAEALVRWQHPVHGFISPAVFIPVAEASGLIDVIGEWVLSTACAQSKVWEMQLLPTVPISVNLSGYQLGRDNLVARVNSILGAADYNPLALQFEVTETFLMQDLAKSEKLLSGLREQGMRIALDDFGTGYSSLNYLSRLPIDTLKIDKSFVDNISDSAQDSELIKHIIDMSHSLGIEVVAEGVEHLSQVELLSKHGCDLLQGFYFSKAVPADEFKSMLMKQPFKK